MTIRISTQARNDAGDAVVDLIDVGSAVAKGYIEIRDGSIPTSPQLPATGKVLAKLEFSNPAFKSFSNGIGQANPITNDSQVDATGLASWFRVYSRDNIAVMDGQITTVGAGGDLEFDNTNFIAGGVVSITSFVATMPQ